MVAEREGMPYSAYLVKTGKKVLRFRLTAAQRLAIFDRDGWTCQLCLHPVSQDADPNGDEGASLDHIVPQSEGGLHEPANLRLAHRWCNTMRWFRPDLDLTQEFARRTAANPIPHGR